MDTLRGHFSGHEGPDDGFDVGAPDDQAQGASPPAEIGRDERRMQVRAYNFWASLLDNRLFPDIAALHPDRLPDFGPYSVLLDFTDGIENPAIAYLGGELAQECDAHGELSRLADVPARSLLSRITDHYMQIIANQAPVGFEAEFVNQRGSTILYRGILLPFSRDDQTIDHIYGVINWKELADQAATDRLMQQVDDAIDTPASRMPAMLRSAGPMTEWADGPADLGRGSAEDDYVPVAFPAVEFGMQDMPFEAGATAGGAESMSLADWLAAARDEAQVARSAEERSRKALYQAISRAYDFALAAAQDPETFAELVEDAGLVVQERAPLIPLVKLVFGADYDKTRLTEFATAIAHGQRLGIGQDGLAGLLAQTPGGLKGIVATERALRREDTGEPAPLSRHEQVLAELRALSPLPLSALGAGSEFTVLVARRDETGQIVVIGEVGDDESLLDRVARRLLD